MNVALEVSESASLRGRAVIADVSELNRYPDLQFITELLTSELVSNVLRHAGLPDGELFQLAVDCDEDTVRVEVVDRGGGFNPLALLRLHKANKARHRGIALVNALADRWGYRCQDHQCHLWFELDLIPGRRPWRGREPIRPGH